MRFVALAPEPFLSACLEVLERAAIEARLIAYGGRNGLTAEQSERLGDLMDAIHNIPDLLQRWEDCDERLLRLFLQSFAEKWQTTVLLGTYLGLVDPASS